jgi:hypothetical protein
LAADPPDGPSFVLEHGAIRVHEGLYTVELPPNRHPVSK